MTHAGFLNRHGFDFYIFAPKRCDDLRLAWTRPWPEGEWSALLETRRVFARAGVRFGGGLSPYALYQNLNSETELALLERAIASGLPTLGICRGTQLLNVALGGTLFDHLPDHVGEEVDHRLPPREPTPHTLEVEEGSGLAGILGETSFTAESWHHQAIDNVAPGLTVVARAPDGTIEAIEKPDHPWLYAVQWHPELTAAEDPIQQRLFNSLAEAALAARQAATGNEGESE